MIVILFFLILVQIFFFSFQNIDPYKNAYVWCSCRDLEGVRPRVESLVLGEWSSVLSEWWVGTYQRRSDAKVSIWMSEL